MTSWYQDHIDNFIVSHLQEDQDGKYEMLIQHEVPLGYFDQEELTVIKNSWRSVKKAAKGKRVLLAGRDVFIFEILAQREGYPTTFMPEVSRATVGHFRGTHDFSDHFLFDTGFAGSIPRGLGMRDFGLLSYSGNKWLDAGLASTSYQTFPRLSWSRGLALKIEKTPKYWESARMESTTQLDGLATITPGEIVQPRSRREEFINAARLTFEVYTNSAPKFIPKHRPMKGGVL